MAKRPKIVFLYSELAGYFLACASELSKKADILIVRWEVNDEAPFNFEFSDAIEVVTKSDHDLEILKQKVLNFKPDAIVCSGWMDKDYLKIIKTFKKQIPTVLTLDNHWTGSIKQKFAAILSPFILTNKFTHAWVPGTPQKLFAKKLGFKNILTGFYCADVTIFNTIYQTQNPIFKNQFLYVGRYVKHKGIFEMWQAFIELQNESPNDWEMICIGTGEAWDTKLEHPKIKHIGFVQPSDLKLYLKDKKIYILPSKFEPWGVTVQEFALAGCPLILSKNVGAYERFLINSENGVLINEVTVDQLKKAMKHIMNLSKVKKLEMSEKSHQLGMSYTPEMWTNKILSIL
jgi:glycosyltransferase involved in cell wall biosynthesis